MALILIVDDSPTEVHAMKTALERHGYQIASAADGAEALPGTPEQYAADIDREERTWSKVVNALGLKGE